MKKQSKTTKSPKGQPKVKDLQAKGGARVKGGLTVNAGAGNDMIGVTKRK